jgi:hypothetical protein
LLLDGVYHDEIVSMTCGDFFAVKWVSNGLCWGQNHQGRQIEPTQWPLESELLKESLDDPVSEERYRRGHVE